MTPLSNVPTILRMGWLAIIDSLHPLARKPPVQFVQIRDPSHEVLRRRDPILAELHRLHRIRLLLFKY